MIIEPFAVGQADRIELFGDGKDDMVVLYRISIFHTVFHPKCLPGTLAFGTVAVSAGVITDMLPSAMIALVLMAAQG